jgi:hypothetical protein
MGLPLPKWLVSKPQVIEEVYVRILPHLLVVHQLAVESEIEGQLGPAQDDAAGLPVSLNGFYHRQVLGSVRILDDAVQEAAYAWRDEATGQKKREHGGSPTAAD